MKLSTVEYIDTYISTYKIHTQILDTGADVICTYILVPVQCFFFTGYNVGGFQVYFCIKVYWIQVPRSKYMCAGYMFRDLYEYNLDTGFQV